MSDDVAQDLKAYANHFARRDWEYSRDHDIKHIRYAGDYKGYDSWGKRIRRTFLPSQSSRRLSRSLNKMFGDLREPWWRHPNKAVITAWWKIYAHFRVGLRTQTHTPDGTINGIITHWEEDGEYIQMVQPSVGDLLADFLLDEPNHPHAVLIRAELQRIRDNYAARIAGDVDLDGGDGQ